MKKYNVFISYRRDGGEFLALLLKERLATLGYNVFCDVESIGSGNFPEQIEEAIEMCDDVLVVLSPNALDKCSEENDWMRKEIECAIKNNKNIIPVMMRSFEYPKVLPGEINGIEFNQGVEISIVNFESNIKEIVKLLTLKGAEAFKHHKDVLDRIEQSFKKIFSQEESDTSKTIRASFNLIKALCELGEVEIKLMKEAINRYESLGELDYAAIRIINDYVNMLIKLGKKQDACWFANIAFDWWAKQEDNSETDNNPVYREVFDNALSLGLLE